jgi:dTDP-4-dehydrorhamnose reductase
LKRVLVTGATGLLGVEVVKALESDGIEPIATARASASYKLDVTDPIATIQLISELQPDAVIHCAAYTKVDKAEEERDEAFRVNVEGCYAIAAACAALNVPLCAISTDFVFDGTKTEPYIEADPVRPLSAYGASKLEGEEIIKSTWANHWIVRTSWLFGPAAKCFPDTILRAAGNSPEVRVVNDQRGTPTYTKDLAAAIVRLIKYPVYGTYHVANSADNGSTTWYELAKTTLELAGVSTPVLPVTTQAWPTAARRPANSALRCRMFELHGLTLLRNWREALAEYVQLRKASLKP